MTICLRCHRPLKRPTESGFGPVCAKAVKPTLEVERDLFGYDIDSAVLAASARLAEFIDFRSWQEQRAVSEAFRDARKQAYERALA